MQENQLFQPVLSSFSIHLSVRPRSTTRRAGRQKIFHALQFSVTGRYRFEAKFSTMGTLAVIVISCGPPKPPLHYPVSPGKGPSRCWESTLINRIKATLCLLWLPTRRTFFFTEGEDQVGSSSSSSTMRWRENQCGRSIWKGSENGATRTRWQLTSLSFTRVASLFTYLGPRYVSTIRLRPSCFAVRWKLSTPFYFFLLVDINPRQTGWKTWCLFFFLWFRFNHLWSERISSVTSDVVLNHLPRFSPLLWFSVSSLDVGDVLRFGRFYIIAGWNSRDSYKH